MSAFAYDRSQPQQVAFADIPHLEGQHFLGPWFVLQESDRDLFSRATWLDRVYLEPPAPEFGDEVVEGFLLLGLLDALWNQVICFDRSTTYSVNYGVDRVRFIVPVLLGQSLRLQLAVREVTPRAGGHLVRMHCTIEIEGSARPGVVADWLVLTRPRAESTTTREGNGHV